MSQLSTGLRRSLRKIAKMFNHAPKAAHRPVAPKKWQLEELEQRDVPATFYVATTGSDSAAGGTANPWRTLQYAADHIAAGDTVIVRSGTYSGFTLYTDGTASNRIVFQTDTNASVTINARSSVTAATHGAINLEGADYVTVDGFNVVMATTGSVNSNIRSVGNTGVIIRNNTIDNAKVWGILTGFSENILIENNTISDTQEQHGIYVGNSADNPTIRGNTVTNSHLCGIQINSDHYAGGDGIITGALVEGNTLLNNATYGGASINFDGVQDSIIRNNVIYGSRNGIALYMTDGLEGAKNNMILGNTIVFPSGVGFWAVSIVGGSTGTKVFNNVLYRQASGSYGSIGIDPDCTTGFQSDYNAVVDKFNRDTFNDAPVTFAQWKTQTGQDAHSFIATPAQLFVDPANNDYHLKAGSPAINAGIDLTDLTTDIEGNTRPSGSTTDVGAYEYQSAASGASQFTVSTPTAATAGNSFTVTVTAKDAAGNTATGYTGTVRFTSSDAQATLPVNYTFVAGDAGVKSFTVTLKTSGSRTVVAADTASASVTGTAAVTVAAAAASTVTVNAPSTATAGTSFTVTATAKDAYGNTATGYTGTVRFTSSDAQATLPVNYTFVAGDAGVKSFTVTLKTAGSKSVTATDTATGSITGSASTTVSAAAASAAQLSAPSTATAGTSFTVTATAKDAYGNTATGYTGTVRFTSSDTQATLPADYTFTAGDAGVRTFNVTLRTAGARSLTVTDTVASGITGSANTTVNASSGIVELSAPSAAVAGTSFTVTATVKDAFGNVDTSYRGTVRFTSSDAQAVLPANYTFVAGDAGVKSFTVTLKTAGSKSVTATDTATGSITGSASTAVSAAAASAAQLSAPSAATAGTAFTATVTLKDAYGNTATGYRGTVRFTSTDAQAALPANYTFTAGDAGVKTFTVTLKTAGARSLTATDTTTASITASTSATVAAAAASTVTVNAPSTATAGTSFTVTATAKDAYGNTATGYTGTVRFTSSDAQATLPVNYTFVAGDAGVKSFTVTLKTSGSRTVVATDTTTGSITGTDTVAVSAAAASTVQLSAPSTATAGTAFSVTATVKDAYGNTATGYTGTVRFTSSDAQAVLPANYTFVAGDAGAKSFTVTLKTTGARSVTVTDTATSSITATANATVSTAPSVPPRPARTTLTAMGSAPGAPSALYVYDEAGALRMAAPSPFGGTGGLKVAVGDVNNDGFDDIILTPATGVGGGCVMILSGRDFGVLANYTIAPGFAGFAAGVNVAAGDVNGDGTDDVILGAAARSDAVIVLSGATQNALMVKFAFGGVNTGVTVAAGDFDGDGRADVVAGTATSYGFAAVYSGASQQLLLTSMPLGTGYTGGISVAAGDLNGDRRADLVMGLNSFGAAVTVDTASGASAVRFAYPGQNVGVSVSTTDRNKDGIAEVVTGLVGGLPLVRVFSGPTFAQIAEFYAYQPGIAVSRTGVYVAGSSRV